MSDLNSLLPVIAIIATAIVGSIAYRLQKSADRKSALIELRRQGYTSFLDSLFVYMHDKSAESSKTHFRKLMELSAIASDEVVRKAGDMKIYLSKSPEHQIDNTKAADLISDLILSIRKDCFERSKLTLEEIRKIAPFR
jgi:hypothetical protein